LAQKLSWTHNYTVLVHLKLDELQFDEIVVEGSYSGVLICTKDELSSQVLKLLLRHYNSHI
jgi:hypothetical protein